MANSIVDVVMNFEREMEVYLGDLPCVSAARLGLHAKACNAVWIDTEALIVHKLGSFRFEHYTQLGGSPGRMLAGEYVLYTVEDPEVAQVIKAYWDMVEQEARWGLPTYQGADY